MAHPNEEHARAGFRADQDNDAAQPERPAQAADAAQEVASNEAGLDLAAENADLKDRLLRALAETENVRRRAERERTEAAQYGLTNFARDVVGIADNLRRALDSLGQEARERADATTRALIEGVEVTERELQNALERHKIRPVNPQKGERFDPNFHQAMFEVEQPDAAPGTVAQVVQTGYVIGDRLLRPALVGVAKASAAPRDGGSAARLDTSA